MSVKKLQYAIRKTENQCHFWAVRMTFHLSNIQHILILGVRSSNTAAVCAGDGERRDKTSVFDDLTMRPGWDIQISACLRHNPLMARFQESLPKIENYRIDQTRIDLYCQCEQNKENLLAVNRNYSSWKEAVFQLVCCFLLSCTFFQRGGGQTGWNGCFTIQMASSVVGLVWMSVRGGNVVPVTCWVASLSPPVFLSAAEEALDGGGTVLTSFRSVVLAGPSSHWGEVCHDVDKEGNAQLMFLIFWSLISSPWWCVEVQVNNQFFGFPCIDTGVSSAGNHPKKIPGSVICCLLSLSMMRQMIAESSENCCWWQLADLCMKLKYGGWRGGEPGLFPAGPLFIYCGRLVRSVIHAVRWWSTPVHLSIRRQWRNQKKIILPVLHAFSSWERNLGR